MKIINWVVPTIALLIFMVAAPAASAHVTLHPEESSTDAWEKFSVRVPVEKDMNTTEVELKVPEEVDLVNVMPIAGWDYELEKDDDGVITSVTWEETDGGIGPNEFTEFEIVASNPSDEMEVSWDAYQTYEDDSVVEWDGAPDSDEPAPVTEVVEGDATAQHDESEETDVDNNQESNDSDTDASGSNNWIPIALSSLALLLALISLFRKK